MFSTFRMPQIAKFYLIIPALAGICLLDFYFFKDSIKNALPSQIESLLVVNLIFNLPHIIASELTLARKDYIKTYMQPILVLIILCSIFSIVFTIFFPEKVLVWFSILTIVHVIGQQFGLCASLSTVPRILYNFWQYLGILLGVFQYLQIYRVKLPFSEIQATYFFLGTSFIFTLMAIYIFFHQRNLTGRQLVLGNWAIVITPMFFLHFGYPIFTSFIPRFVHDVTAFYAYFVHNYNVQLKSIGSPPKMTYSQFVYLFCFTLIIPVLFAAPFTLGWFGQYGVMFTLMASLFHYGMESYAWRRGSMPREYLKI